ncbi:hypothetical protein OG21DRAFT_1601686 [Imleria badia]|nr:hypothetical protein OG21DRAFT_1601686 [Imleria badia]
MIPTPIYHHTVSFFADCVKKLLTPYDSGGAQVSHLFNSTIELGHGKSVVPDIRLNLMPGYTTYERAVTTWIGEVDFSQSRAGGREFPTIDAAFMITIHEAEYNLPQDPKHVLVSQPLTGADFFTGPLTKPVTELSPVVVGDVKWAAINAVNLFVFLRGDDGKFNFSIDDENPNAACGVLHPGIDMENVTTLLNTASQRLINLIADMMEDHHDDVARIHLLRNEVATVTFPIDWSGFLWDIQHALFSTALARYNIWLDRQLSKQISVEPGHSNRRKQPANSAGSRKKKRSRYRM